MDNKKDFQHPYILGYNMNIPPYLGDPCRTRTCNQLIKSLDWSRPTRTYRYNVSNTAIYRGDLPTITSIISINYYPVAHTIAHKNSNSWQICPCQIFWKYTHFGALNGIAVFKVIIFKEQYKTLYQPSFGLLALSVVLNEFSLFTTLSGFAFFTGGKHYICIFPDGQEKLNAVNLTVYLSPTQTIQEVKR